MVVFKDELAVCVRKRKAGAPTCRGRHLPIDPLASDPSPRISGPKQQEAPVSSARSRTRRTNLVRFRHLVKILLEHPIP